MPPQTPSTRRERRFDLAYAVVPHVALTVSLILALTSEDQLTGRYLAWTLGVTGIAAGWLLTMRVKVGEEVGHRVKAVLFYVGLLALIGLLIFINPFYAIFGFTGYLFVPLVPGRWKAAGMVANAGLMAMSEVGGANQLQGKAWIAYFGLFLVNVFIVGSMTKAAIDDDRRAEQRTRTIDQLSEANRQLEQIMEENAGLHAQLVAQAREAGVFDERQRMAGEIHDTLAQGLTGILAQLEAAELTDGDEARRQRHLGLAKELARDSLAEARRSVQALRPQKLDGARLPDAVRTLAEDWKQTSGIPVRVEVDGDAMPLQPALEVVLFRAAQEALANIAKHAQATRAGMTLTYMHDQVSLDVLDDGKGFDAQRLNGNGYGLAAMRQRLRQVGGGMEIESTPGDGTTVSASVPALYRVERTETDET